MSGVAVPNVTSVKNGVVSPHVHGITARADVSNIRADVSVNAPVGGGVVADNGGVVPIEKGGTPNLVNSVRKSVWERLEPPVGATELQSKSFASIVGSVPKPALDFFPVEKESTGRVVIPLTLTKSIVKSFRMVLLGYFLGPRIPFPIVLRAARLAWGKFGFQDAMVNDHGFFFFRFNDEGGCLNVIEAPPLLIRGAPLFVTPWDPSKGICKPVHTSCPLWIKFYNIPLVAFNREGISRIASAVGVPLRMDACTSSTCDKLWGRTSFAKVLVDVWATGTLKREVEVVIPHMSDDGEDVIKVVLEYEWEPSQCSGCKIFGHSDVSCMHREKEVQVKGKGKQKEKAGDDGFQLVRKKQWRPKPVGKKVMPDSSGASNRGTSEGVDSLTGVGTLKQVHKEGFVTPGAAPNSLSEQVISQPIVAPVDVRDPSKDGKEEEQVRVGTSGEFCTLNAGRTPCAKEGQDKVVETLPHEPNLVQSVVNTFKSLPLPKRGQYVTTNRFSPLSDDDDDDMELIDIEPVISQSRDAGVDEPSVVSNSVNGSVKLGDVAGPSVLND